MSKTPAEWQGVPKPLKRLIASFVRGNEEILNENSLYTMKERKLKRCDSCSSEFFLQGKGSGGSNRRFCYTCLPRGLSRNERSLRRNSLLTRMAHSHKEALGCNRCGYSKFGGALEWHHPEGDKEHDPAEALARSWDAYLAESSKCILLCANCHREVHAGV